MLFINKSLTKKFLLTLFLALSLTLFAACTGNSTSNSNTEDSEHEHSEEDGEHERSEDRIPNPDGAAVTILSPADGAAFAEGDEVIVEIQVDNFTLGEDNSHWHVYVDGSSWGMIMGGNTSESLRGIEPGEHEISVYIAGGDHIEFEEGDAIHITVE